MEEKKFKQWLENKVGLKPRSSRDVIFRLKRANRFVNITLSPTSDHAISELSYQPNFQELSIILNHNFAAPSIFFSNSVLITVLYSIISEKK